MLLNCFSPNLHVNLQIFMLKFMIIRLHLMISASDAALWCLVISASDVALWCLVISVSDLKSLCVDLVVISD